MRKGAIVLGIGLTGGIGSGKSTVAQMLVGCGAHLVDTDAIARSLTVAGGAAMPAVAAAFGAQSVAAEGALDREFMRRLVFADPSARARLEGILHPLIGQQARQLALAASGRVVVFDVPLLTESGHWRARVDRVLVVDCPAETQLSRVAQRPGWTTEATARVLAQQATREARRAIADAVVFNQGLSLADLEGEVRQVWTAWVVPA
jgi:dephospho-CoA kinase